MAPPAQLERYRVFKVLHERPGAFVIPNPWDAGSARLLTALGFEALATTSAGYAFSIGQPDAAHGLTRDQALANARAIVAATPLPVSADLEGGFGAAAGLVGGSIEDASGDPAQPIYTLDHAVERVAAAAEAARALPFLVTARAENYLYGRPDLDDTIRRLRAFAAAGAGVVYAPGLPSLDAIRTVCASVDKPVNVVMGLAGQAFTVAALEAAGVKRISVGSAFARAALGGLLRAAREVKERGTFSVAAEAPPFAEINACMAGARKP